MLGLPIATFVSRIEAVEPGHREGGAVEGASLSVVRLVEGGYERIRLPLPCLITVVNEIGVPRLPTLSGKQAARDKEINRQSKATIALDETRLGLRGSPTKVVKITRPKAARNGVVIDSRQMGPEVAVRRLVHFLEEKHLV